MKRRIGLLLGISCCLLAIAICGILYLNIIGLKPIQIQGQVLVSAPNGQQVLIESEQENLTEIQVIENIKPKEPVVYKTKTNMPSQDIDSKDETTVTVQHSNVASTYLFYGDGITKHINTQPGQTYPIYLRIPKNVTVTNASFEVRSE